MRILFVWDFHGTLEKDNVKAVREIINKVLALYGLRRKIRLNETVRHYGLSWVDYFKYVYPKGNLKIWNEMKERARGFQKKEKIVEKYIKPAPYARTVLKTIKKKGHKNIVVSNSKNYWIKYFTRLVKLNSYFDRHIGLDLHDIVRRGKDVSQAKYKVVRKYLLRNRFQKLVKIGDRESDIKAGKMIGAVTYYLRNQYNRNHRLKIKPDYIISDLRKVLKEL